MAENKVGLGQKILTGVGIAAAAFLVAFAGASAVKKDEPVDFDKLVADALEAQAKQDASAQANLSSDVVQVKEDVKVLSDKLLEQDLFEASVEVLAKDEVEHKGYRDLYNYLDFTYGDIFEKSDISDMVYRNVDITGVDVDEGDATVDLDLKVYYENVNGTSVKRYITATVVIVDNEVDSLVFS